MSYSQGQFIQGNLLHFQTATDAQRGLWQRGFNTSLAVGHMHAFLSPFYHSYPTKDTHYLH
jgi:hypothetical protein